MLSINAIRQRKTWIHLLKTCIICFRLCRWPHSQFLCLGRNESKQNRMVESQNRHLPSHAIGGGKTTQLFDQTRKAFVDLSWTVAGYTPGRFSKNGRHLNFSFHSRLKKRPVWPTKDYSENRKLQDEMKKMSTHSHCILTLQVLFHCTRQSPLKR